MWTRLRRAVMPAPWGAFPLADLVVSSAGSDVHEQQKVELVLVRSPHRPIILRSELRRAPSRIPASLYDDIEFHFFSSFVPRMFPGACGVFSCVASRPGNMPSLFRFICDSRDFRAPCRFSVLGFDSDLGRNREPTATGEAFSTRQHALRLAIRRRSMASAAVTLSTTPGNRG